MSYYFLPKIHNNIQNHIITYSPTTFEYIDNILPTIGYISGKIEKDQERYNKKLWLDNKKLFNMYNIEYLQEISCYNNIYKHLYLILELNNLYDFIEPYYNASLNILYLCKSQFDIIETIHYLRGKKDIHNCIYYKNIKNNNNFIEQNENIRVNKQILFDFLNIEYLTMLFSSYSNLYDKIFFIENDNLDYYKNKNKFITCDEINFIKVFFSLIQIKHNGTLVFKLNNLLEYFNYELLYLLSSCFDKVILLKPNISSNISSEIYIVCKKYNINKYNNLFFFNIITHNIQKIINKLDSENVLQLFKFKLPLFFKNKLNELVTIFSQQQVDNITNMTKVIFNNNFDESRKNMLVKKSMQKCVFWCIHNKIEYDKSYMENNDFF